MLICAFVVCTGVPLGVNPQMMSTLVVPVGRWGPPAFSWGGVTCRRVFEKRLDRLYTATFKRPSNLSVVCEGVLPTLCCDLSQAKGTQPLPLTPSFNTWHVGDKEGRRSQQRRGFHQDRTERSYTPSYICVPPELTR